MNRSPSRLLSRLAGALLALSFAGTVSAIATPASNFRAALDYGARFSAEHNDWQVYRADGRSLHVLADVDCQNDQGPPNGLWILSRDGDGQPELLAPSALALPAGHSGRVTLLACGAPAQTGDGEVLRVPAELLGWLVDNTGTVYVGR